MASGSGLLGPAPNNAFNSNPKHGPVMGQSVVLPKPAATGMGGMAAMGGMPASLQARSPDANRLARLQAILTRFEVSIAEANDLAVLEDYEIVLILDDSGSMNAGSKPPGQRSLTEDGASTTRWEELKETTALLVEIACCFDKFLFLSFHSALSQERLRPTLGRQLRSSTAGLHPFNRVPQHGGVTLRW
ncbi:unnamed protein product [Durusdinium trenchii]|uniref:Mediator of RNA polymerase II transcription subunit 25 n=1 Tax=Durusdinium trenchii TaxID=1381693 RepID=A0ABP0RG70_9DINO